MTEEIISQLNNRIGPYDRRQILIWQQIGMTPAERLANADQAYHFALEAVRLTIRRHPDLSEEEFKWLVIRRMHGDQSLGQE